MYNDRIADIFDKIADILEFKQDNPFKIRAYRRASQQLRSLSESIEAYAKKDTLTNLPGIGKELSDKIKEMVETGRISAYEKLKREVSQGVIDVMSIPGIGPKTAKVLYDGLKIDSVARLKKMAKSGRLSSLPHIKEKTQQNILKAIDFIEGSSDRMLLGQALPIAEEIIDSLRSCKGLRHIDYAGSLRRMQETVRDIDILVGSDRPAEVMERFMGLPQAGKVVMHGQTRSSVITEAGIQIDIRVVEPSSYGAALVYFTGSKAHNIGFVFAAYAIGRLLNRRNGLPAIITALILGELIILSFGAAWMCMGLGFDIRQAFYLGVVPFIPGDIVKIAVCIPICRLYIKRARSIFG
jgi:DNA polymerase (family 10)